MGCVVAAATGQVELGIPCVVGGAAYSAGMQYISH
jgi:CO dehydrogenase/acetyl-CoA synthase alpha subunit